jgi:hypothetical protein
MTLGTYKDLIRNLPYLDQAFETKQSIWNRRAYLSNEAFKTFFENSFVSERAMFSRGELFKAGSDNVSHAIFSIILWGYPRNMRGNTFGRILNSLPEVATILNGKKELSGDEFRGIVTQLSGTGVGFSTLSKFLYFLNFKIEGQRCLIFDSRIIDVLNGGYFAELQNLQNITPLNKAQKYLTFLELIAHTSAVNGYAVDQLELFLFTFGKNLKATA